MTENYVVIRGMKDERMARRGHFDSDTWKQDIGGGYGAVYICVYI